MRVELAALGVRVVLLEPGAVETGFQEKAVGERMQAHPGSSPFAAANRWMRESSYRPLFMMRSVSPIDVARLVGGILASSRPRARYVAPFAARLLLLFMGVTPTRILDPLKRRIFHIMPGPAPRR